MFGVKKHGGGVGDWGPELKGGGHTDEHSGPRGERMAVMGHEQERGVRLRSQVTKIKPSHLRTVVHVFSLQGCWCSNNRYLEMQTATEKEGIRFPKQARATGQSIS